MKTDYEIMENPMTGDIMWKINDIDLAITDCGKSLMEQFIKQHRNEEYTLSIYDDITKNTIEIDASIIKMPEIVSNIYRIEHATPMSFIGVNSLSDSYVVGMTLTKGHIDFGCYKYINGKLTRLIK